MKAAVYTRYGPPEVVEMRDTAKPAPAEKEILVRVRATTVCAGDWRMRRASPFPIRVMNGLWKPVKYPVLGMEFSGTVEAAGAGATRFRAGDEVFGSTGFRFGAHAEYVCLPEDGTVASKPATLTLEDAAAIPFGGISALYFLRLAKIQAGQRVLIYGASGSVGVFAVQLAKYFGAQVTGVCSGANVDTVRSLGADDVVDYTKEDFSSAGRVYDTVVDTVGESGFARTLRCLRRGGAYVRVGATGGMGRILADSLRAEWVARTGAAKLIGGVARGDSADLAFLKELIEAGKLHTVIDRRYPLERIVDAHRHAEGGHKRGHVVILVGCGTE